jgi:hypothetical protein
LVSMLSCTALRFSSRSSALKLDLPKPTCTLPALSARYSTLPPLNSLTACGGQRRSSQRQAKEGSLSSWSCRAHAEHPFLRMLAACTASASQLKTWLPGPTVRQCETVCGFAAA